MNLSKVHPEQNKEVTETGNFCFSESNQFSSGNPWLQGQPNLTSPELLRSPAQLSLCSVPIGDQDAQVQNS